jgi:predicted transcriptional regulator
MTTGDVEASLEAVRFFADSANSVRVFEALDEGVTTSSALAERTGASRSTVARILGEGESRGWIESEGSRYGLTYTGECMIDEFRTHLRTVAGVQRLGDALNSLPEPARELDVRHLRDADLTVPTADRPDAHLSRALELYRTADTYRGLTRVAPDVVVRTLADLVEEGLDLAGVVPADVVAGLRDDPERAAPWHVIADGVRVYDGAVPLNVHILDGTVALWLDGADPTTHEGRGLLESENQAVVSWAESLYRRYRDEADPLDVARLPEP